MTTPTSPTGLYRSIHTQPQAVRALLQDWSTPEQAAKRLAQTGRIFLAGIGTSFHAATVGEYLLRAVGVDAWAVRSFEFVHYPRPLKSSDGIIIISHRGSKLHGTLAVQRAIEAHVATVGITGKNSKMQGPEIVVETVEQDPSSTHSISYMGSLTRLAQLAVCLGRELGHTEQAAALERGLHSIPERIEQVLEREEEIREIAREAVAHQRRIYFIGAGPNAVTAPEGALKAKEAAYVTTEGFELEQAIHGPLVAFEKEDLLIPIAVNGPAQPRMAELLAALGEIQTKVCLIGDIPDKETETLFTQNAWKSFSIGNGTNIQEELTPLLTVVPVQLLAEFLAEARGTNADSFRTDDEVYKQAGKRYNI